MKENLKFLFSSVVLIGLILSCSKLDFSFGDKSDKLYFCEKYILKDDNCEGKSTKFTTGALTVMVDTRPTGKKLGVDKVNINITDLKTREVVETYPYDAKEDMDYIYFDNVVFKKPGKYKVSALKPDGTIIVSNEIEIINKE